MTGEPTLNYWPLVITIEDVFIPELASAMIETIQDAHVNTVAAMLAVASYQAELNLRGREN